MAKIKFLTVTRIISGGIVGMTGLMYVNQLLRDHSPSEKISIIGLSALAVIGALSGLCFALHPCLKSEEEKNNILYGGEKFFHACLLIIQTIFIRYAVEHFPQLGFLGESKLALTIKFFLMFTLQITQGFIGMYAIYFCIYGFWELDNFFWVRFENRLKEKQMYSKKKNTNTWTLPGVDDNPRRPIS